MPDKVIEHFSLLMYALAAISGGLGGCTAFGVNTLQGSTPRLSYVMAYIFIGITFGLLVFIYGNMFGVPVTTMGDVIGASIIAGACSSLSLASTNFSARWVLKKLGIEIEVKVKKLRNNNTGNKNAG